MLFINASDILLSFLFKLLLVNITILVCFFFLFLFFLNFLTTPFEIENARLKLALAIPTDAPVTFVNDVIEMLPLVTDKPIKDLSTYLKKQHIY